MAESRGTTTAALGGLALSCFILSNRYHASAVFDHPLQLTFSTLLLTGLALLLLRRVSGPPGQLPPTFEEELVPLASPPMSPNTAKRKISTGCTLRLCAQPITLAGLIVVRCLLFSLVIRTSQCAWPGVEALLPLLSLLFELASFNSSKSVGKGAAGPNKSSWSQSAAVYLVLSLGWAISAMLALARSRAETGTVCLPGWKWARFTPCAQLAVCALDAAALRYGAHVRSRETRAEHDRSPGLAPGFLLAAACLFLFCSVFSTSLTSLCHNSTLGSLDMRDLALDSLLTSIALVCIFALLADLRPACLALLVSETSLFGHLFLAFAFPSSQAPHFPSKLLSGAASLLAAVFAAFLWFLAATSSNASRTRAVRPNRWLLISHMSLVILAVVLWALYSTESPQPSVSEAVGKLVATGQKDKIAWTSQAAASKSLPEAVAEYKRRRGMPPPPNFDKWYEYAIKSKSAVIDDFAQIHNDILPFWGIEPSKIRESTRRLLAYSHTEMAGLSIQNGTINQSPHVPGTHRWMTNMMEKMIEPFAQWLPDMVLAINLADESRVTVPFKDMRALKARAQNSILGVSGKKPSQSAPSGLLRGPAWDHDFSEPILWDRLGATGPHQVTPDFIDYHSRQTYHDWIATTCPPWSAARRSRWWDRGSVCWACQAPHSLMTRSGPILAEKSLAHDLCHQPDMAGLHGFISSPTVSLLSQDLLPIFSQSRIGGFSDVLVPSPWDFEDKSAYIENEDVSWAEKTNGIYWRGSSTDGFAAQGSWVGFLRARFVHEAFQASTEKASNGMSRDFSINVSFVGDIPRCDSGDCAAELRMFSRWAAMTKSKQKDVSARPNEKAAAQQGGGLPLALPFKEGWHFRHLMDMDGAGFSGRFLSFLRSHSLPYRAALFKTWYDERLFGWHDYIPVDVRLGPSLWSVLRFLSGGGVDFDEGRGTQGANTARMISEQGRRSASRLIRREDMHVYMFRLLLEWGRVTDDDRERLVYE